MCTDQVTDPVLISQLFAPITSFQTTQTVPWRYVRRRSDNEKAFYQSGNRIIFKLEKEGVLDMDSIALLFNANMSLPTQALVRNFEFVNNIENVFSRMQLLYNNVVVEDIVEPGIIGKILSIEDSSFNQYMTVDGAMSGNMNETPVTALTAPYGRFNYHTKNKAGTATLGEVARRYVIKLRFGLFQQNKPLPLHMMGGQWSIQLEVADINRSGFCATAIGPLDLTGAKTNVGLPELIYKTFHANDYTDLLYAQIRQHPLTLQFSTFQYFKRNLNTAAKVHNVRIPCGRKRLLRAYAVLRSDYDVLNSFQDPTNFYNSLDGRASSNSVYNGVRETALRSYQWTYNQHRIPETPIVVIQENPCTTQDLTVDSISEGYTSTGAEAWYFYKEAIRAKRRDGMHFLPGFDGSWTTLSSGIVGAGGNNATTKPVLTRVSDNGGSSAAYRSYPSRFVMVGQFSGIDSQGRPWALAGSNNNAQLYLNLEFLSQFTTTMSAQGSWGSLSVQPSMNLEVFLEYDNVMTIDENNNMILDC